MPAPLPHQREAITDLKASLRCNDRAQLISACGSGKTLTGWWVTQDLLDDDGAREGGLVLVVVPSLLLLAQTFDAWADAASVEGRGFEPFVVCSDPSTTAGRDERAGGGFEKGSPLAARATTNPVRIARRLAERPRRRPLVVFSTYHSLPKVFEACATTPACFDMVVLDEAHRLVRGAQDEWLGVLDDETLPATRRLSMTATRVIAPQQLEDRELPPRASMDDERLFGPVAHHLSFSEAVRRGLLVDIEVVVAGRASSSGTAEAGLVTLGLAAAANRGASRALTFHGRVAKARTFADSVDGMRLDDERRVAATWVDGTMSIDKRRRRLETLTTADATGVRVVASSRCLTEGIDVPAVDALVFADPKETEVETAQAVGRVMRTAEGKRKGIVVIPVRVDDRLDNDTALSSGTYATVWKTLRQIIELDDTLAEEFARYQREIGEGTSRPRPPRGVIFDLPADIDTSRVTGHLVDRAAGAWHRFYGLLLAYVAEHGTTLGIPCSHRAPDGTALGMWVRRNRRAYARGALASEKAALLSALPGWVWDQRESGWLLGWSKVAGAVETSASGSLAEACAGRDEALASIRIPSRGKGVRSRALTTWAAVQRIAARHRDLTSRQMSLLGDIPGWDPAPTQPGDAAMVDLLAEYAAWKADANPPSGYMMDDEPLGAWLDDVRRRKALGRLEPELETEIAVVTPHPGVPGALQWKTREVLWLFKYEALREYIKREQTARIAWKHVEVYDGVEVPLSDWCRNQRHQHRHGKLPPACAHALERLPGWLWEVPNRDGTRPVLEGVEHGTRRAYVKGCGCDDCLEANARASLDREQRKAAGLATTDLVDASPARGHLRVLQGRGATQKGMARALGLNPKTVSEVLHGTTRRILPETNKAVLALTLADVTNAASGGSCIDAEATWRLLDDLIDRGWPRAWIARELGRRGPSIQLSRSTVTAANAEAVRTLHRRLSGIPVPPARHRKPRPTLAEIEAQMSTGEAS